MARDKDKTGAGPKASDLRHKTDKELATRLEELNRERFNLRFQRATGQLANTARVRAVRREIARIQTVLNERVRKAAGSAA